MRNVALFASQRSSTEFNKYWPAVDQQDSDKKVWGMTKEDAEATREQVMKAHNVVLKST